MPNTSEFETQLIAWRRDLHAHPEFGFEEHRTARFVAETLRTFGLDVVEGVGGTGVVATLTAGTGNRSIALRADIGFDGWPRIVENGSGLIKPGANASRNGAVYRKLRPKLSGLTKGFRGFVDLGNGEIVKPTRPSIHAAQKAYTTQIS